MLTAALQTGAGTDSVDFGSYVPAMGVMAVAIVAVVMVRAIVRRRGDETSRESRWQLQAWTFLIAAAGLVAVLMTLPSGDLDKQTILSLIGLALTAVIALSASTIVSNAMSGLMLHSVGNFRPGDFVRIGEHFGRVTERGLFHTELQTESGDLTTLPNAMLVTGAVTVTRSTGTVVSTSVSLGYDVERSRIEHALIRAATDSGLEEPFVHVMELGDFSVSYRVSGFLTDVKHMLRTRSRLRASVLDSLHMDGIEIVSPNFMNQRVLDPAERFIPRRAHRRVTDENRDDVPAQLVFDKAERAGRIEELKDRRQSLNEELADLAERERSGDGDPVRLERRRNAAERMLNHIEFLLNSLSGTE